MKKANQIITTVVITILSFGAVTYTSCKKDDVDPCKSVACLNGGACVKGLCTCPSGYSGTHCETKNTTTITYRNQTFTEMNITVNGTTKIVPSGSSVSYNGLYGDQITMTANTFSASGYGLTLNWSLSDVFPATGTKTEDLNVGSSYFYLQIKNNSTENSNKVFVNYNLVDQSQEGISIPHDGVTYSIGYYRAYSNSNVRVEAASGTYWYYGSLGLPFTNNQGIVLTMLQ